MANILDYLDWRGDLTPQQDAFCTADALILSQLSYIPFDGIVPAHLDDSILLCDAAAAFDPEQTDPLQRSFCYQQDQVLLERLAQSARFRSVRLTGYISRTDAADDLQFSAMTCILHDGTVFLCFRGTDGTIAGWKEDFNMSFLPETPGQRYAVEYLNKLAEHWPDCRIMLGGHSKGGNFAVYAAAFCQPEIQPRIDRIYDLDGPGFRDEIADSPEYATVIPKIVSVIPQSSLVGQLLTSNTGHRIVKSKAYGVAQHLIYAWELLGREPVYADDLSKLGLFINRSVTGWLSEMDDADRAAVTEAVFDVISASDSETFYEISQHKLRSAGAILKAMRKLSPEQQAVLKQAISKLASKSKEALFPEKKPK